MTVNWDCERDGHLFEMGSSRCTAEGCGAVFQTPEAQEAVARPKYDRATAPQMGGEPGFETGDPLEVFLYLLVRDHVHPGDMENLVTEIEYVINVGTPTTLTNRHLAGYAANIARRIRP